MDTKELSLLKRIRFQPGKKLNTLFMGEYHSAFKGHGLAFDAVREYQYGDDVRSIDWNVSARMRTLFVKQYIEERELSVVLMIDMSGSTEFGGERRKLDIILEVATLFLNLAQIHNDRVSVCIFSDRVEKYIRPKKGRKFILKVFDEILKCKPVSRKTSISRGIDFIQRVLKKRSIIFIISDFLDSDDSYLLKMKLLARKHDIIPVQVSDPLERDQRFFGLTEFVDLETGRVFLSDAIPEKGNFPVLSEFNSIALSTAEPIETPILKYFEKRNRTHITRV
ncbi:MAG: hypothetical protein A2176_10275 [Spirochaetes bacterium RBG_13_51_14]|nr:MAG: hypothetical protein A2176_10275 [Spirochaetes bacterium RBG_13_51_14]